MNYKNVCQAVAFIILLSALRVDAAGSTWTLAVLGDQQFAVTRKYGHDWLDRFTSQTKWLAANAKTINLRMVVQVGDIVENSGELTEWDRALAGMQLLDKAPNADGGMGIPWSVAYGNHEIIGAKLNPTIDLAGAEPSSTYRRYFGSAGGTHRYANQVEFKGVSKNDLNTWHIIKASNVAGARSYLMLNLEIDVPGDKEGTNFDAIKWAQGVMNDHRGMPTIITTHVFEGSKYGPPKNAYLKGFGHNSQLEIFDKLVKKNPQVFLVLSGHTSEETHRIRQNAKGQPVLQIVTDYTKWLGDGGDGYFRLIEMDEQAGEIRVTTYSALLDNHRTDGNSQFAVPLNFADRFDAVQNPSLDNSAAGQAVETSPAQARQKVRIVLGG